MDNICRHQECENPNPPDICRKCGEWEGSGVELKPLPCPWCGEMPMQRKWDGHWYVKCDTIKCGGPGMPWVEVKRWNTRPDNEIVEDNRKLKAALGHANAALDGFGGDNEVEDAIIEDLSMLIRRLCNRCQGTQTAKDAMDYLKRKQLLSTTLRIPNDQKKR